MNIEQETVSDLQKLEKLFMSWGVNLRRTPAWEEEDTHISLVCGEQQPKVIGFEGFITVYTFDKDGKFIEMGAWE